MFPTLHNWVSFYPKFIKLLAYYLTTCDQSPSEPLPLDLLFLVAAALDAGSPRGEAELAGVSVSVGMSMTWSTRYPIIPRRHCTNSFHSLIGLRQGGPGALRHAYLTNKY